MINDSKGKENKPRAKIKNKNYFQRMNPGDNND